VVHRTEDVVDIGAWRAEIRHLADIAGGAPFEDERPNAEPPNVTAVPMMYVPASAGSRRRWARNERGTRGDHRRPPPAIIWRR
jgi:hypothetical protein